ncbi:hypothetical protein N7478_010811 [Penicillium angulare]|uniref:uncharacterized protein n=1 Tax=Penicillium angulare TaxID=116970 RepID=UPI00253F7CC2|nr:uncharacterized protein N7478_010811 [Penicillium angulare]KAJ5263206.1 hypothetical protein N7478_010811 [Penicillium angulare]
MRSRGSHIDWFKDSIGATIAFPSGSVCTLSKLIKKRACYENQESEKWGLRSEARGTFVGSKAFGDGPSSGLIKIRLQ